ncbi:hypothetical protein SNEBB_002850, partial [Seison nebaliae]
MVKMDMTNPVSNVDVCFNICGQTYGGDWTGTYDLRLGGCRINYVHSWFDKYRTPIINFDNSCELWATHEPDDGHNVMILFLLSHETQLRHIGAPYQHSTLGDSTNAISAYHTCSNIRIKKKEAKFTISKSSRSLIRDLAIKLPSVDYKLIYGHENLSYDAYSVVLEKSDAGLFRVANFPNIFAMAVGYAAASGDFRAFNQARSTGLDLSFLNGLSLYHHTSTSPESLEWGYTRDNEKMQEQDIKAWTHKRAREVVRTAIYLQSVKLEIFKSLILGAQRAGVTLQTGTNTNWASHVHTNKAG